MIKDYSYLYLGQDIDWFAIDAINEVAHFASGGGMLPFSILGDFENYKNISSFFRNLPEINGNEVIINPLLQKIMCFTSETEREEYLQHYVYLAKRGLYSYDKSLVMADLDYKYHLVASPTILIKLETLPLRIAEVVKKTLSEKPFSNNGLIYSNEIQ